MAQLIEALCHRPVGMGSIPDGVLVFLLELIIPGSTQPLTEVSARDTSWRVKAAGA